MRFGVSADATERVEKVDFGLPWDGGAPMPYLLQGEQRTFLAFYLQEPIAQTPGKLDPGEPWFVVVTPKDVQALGVIEWFGCNGAVLGGLNDEAIHGHPLWKRGLSDAYGSGEVTGSKWIAELSQANSVHPYHSNEPFARLRHFILLFHDELFECIARGFAVYRTRQSMESIHRPTCVPPPRR